MESLVGQFDEMKAGILKERANILGSIDSVMAGLEEARDQTRIAKAGLPGDDAKFKIVTGVNSLAKKLEVLKPTQKVVDANVEYFKHISKFGKGIMKYLNPSIEDASYQVKFPPEILNRVNFQEMLNQ